MKKLKLLLATCVICCTYACTDDDAVVRALAQRIIPDQEVHFRFEHLADTTDCFELQSDNEKIVIRGNNSNSIAVGLNYYLKNYCLTTVSWLSVNPVEMPTVLPEIEGKIRIESRAKNRFFLNYCTFGYTMPWWGWSEWERFIDWMALNGVTMPLSITGQEAVWHHVWTQLGLTDEEIRQYFTGPAHLPWHRMSNIDGWNGPLPIEWLDKQLELQKQIIARERELNMTPILPAFAGHVPKEIKRIYPNANISRISEWGGFTNDRYRCSFLDPRDSLFAVIQQIFLEEQTRLFGTDHIYGADPFNEIDAPNWDTEVLAHTSKHIYESIAAVDPQAVWLQMGWLFYADQTHWTPENIQAYLQAVPQDHLLMLDYFCEYTEIWKQTKSFYGQPYLWCYLGNFGGNTMLSGNLHTVGERIEDAFANGGDNLWGLGSTLEGFGVNQFMYEYVLDKAWKSEITDEEWISRLSDRRTGVRDASAREAWRTLCNEVYIQPAQVGQGTLTNAHPTLESVWLWTTKPTVEYRFASLWRAWSTLLKADSDRDTYRYDVVNIGRQTLGDYFLFVRDRFAEATKKHDRSGMKTAGDEMMEILDDMERLTACHAEFSLQAWLDGARSWGDDAAAKAYYETNARTLISVWGESTCLSDYANRGWAGMLSDYYAPRWRLFITQVMEAEASGRKFDQNAFDREIRSFEEAWVDPTFKLTVSSKSDAIATARELALKYKKRFDTIK